MMDDDQSQTMTALALDPIPAEPAVTTTDQVFAALYAAVISLRLAPGRKLSEADIARQLGVSRQPVRDAFFRLSKLGFLQIRPQRGTLVTKISARAVFDAAFVRTALEAECVRLAAERLTPGDLAMLRDHLARQGRALDAGDPQAFHALDDSFHLALCTIAGHRHVWELILEQKAHMDRVRFLTLSADRQREVLADHTALVEAIAARSPGAADAELRRHLGTIHADLPKIRAAHPGVFDEAEG